MADDLFDIEKLFADDPELAAIFGHTISAPDIQPVVHSAELQTAAAPSDPLAGFDFDPLSLDDLFADLQQPQTDESQSMQPAPEAKTDPVEISFNIPKEYTQIPDEAEQSSPLQAATPEPIAETGAEVPAQPRRKGARVGRVFFNILFYVLIVALIGGAAAFAMSSGTTKSVFGFHLYTVKTNFMTPQEGSLPGGFRVGDAVLVRSAAPGSIQVNDIIAYPDSTYPDTYQINRVVRIMKDLSGNPEFFVTAGDANPSEETTVSAQTVVGRKVLVIPGMGVFFQFLQDNYLLAIVIVVAVFGFVILLRVYFARPKPKKKKIRVQASGA